MGQGMLEDTIQTPETPSIQVAARLMASSETWKLNGHNKGNLFKLSSIHDDIMVAFK